MKKLNRLFEQYRESGRFKPTIPRMVKSTPVVSPRPTSDSAEVKLKEEEQLTEMPGANMDTRAVHSHLKKQGWKLTRTSGSHDVFTHPNSNEHIPVPRHKQLKAPLVLSILRTSKMTNKPRNEEVEIDEARLAMPLKGHAYHYKSDAELKYIQKDAHEAAKAMKGHNPKAEGKYLDQHNDASTVLHYRSKGGQQLQKEETALQRIQRLRDKREDEAREREEDIFHKPKEKKQPSRQVVQGHRYGGSKQKDDVNEDFEQIDELKKTTLMTYIRKASADVGEKGYRSGVAASRNKPEEAKELHRKEMKRQTGIVRAAGKLATGRTTNEDVEHIDEISAQAHQSYQQAARREVPMLAAHSQSGEYKDIAQKILDKRIKGMTRSSALQLRNKMANEEVELTEMINVNKKNYSWGKMITVHHGKSHSYPLHPEHQEAIAKLKDGEKTSFTDETNAKVHASREGDTIHLSKKHVSTPTAVSRSHFVNEETELNELKSSIGAHADKLKKYADEHGGIDKNSFHTAANLMKKGDHEALKNHVRSMDTDARDKVLEHIHPHHWKSLGFSPIGSMESAVKMHNKMHGMNESNDEREYDYEGEMLKSDLRSIMANAQRITDMLEDNDNLPEWCQSKITLAEDYVSTVANYLTAEMNEETEYLEEKNEPTNPELWARAKALAKKKFDVYPSAYSNGWAAKWYKEKGGSWRSVSEEVEQIDEISNKTLGSYLQKAPEQMRSYTQSYVRGIMSGKKSVNQSAQRFGHAASRRQKGIEMAGRKLAKEEVEQIDELSKDTLRSYAAKAIDSTRTMSGTGSKDEGSKKSKRMSSVMLAAKKLNREEVEQIDEVHAPGTKVKVPHNGKMVSGKVVRHDKGDAHGTPFYVVDVGDYESKKVSAHNVQKEETEPPFTPSKPKKNVVVGKRGEGMAKVRHLARMALQKQMKKPVKEEKENSKKAQIVKSAMKKMPDEDKFQKDPELGNTLTKNI